MRKDKEKVICSRCKKKLKFGKAYSDMDFDQHYHKKCYLKEFKEDL